MLTGQEREWIKNMIRVFVAPVVQLAYQKVSTALGISDTNSGYPVDVGEPSYQYTSRRMQHFGFRSVPPPGCEVVRVASGGGGANTLTVAEESQAYGPGNLEVGESAIYSTASGAIVKVNNQGDVIVTPAAGRNVIVADGLVFAARVGDSVSVTIPSGAIQDVGPTLPAASVVVTGTITAGSSKVKVG